VICESRGLVKPIMHTPWYDAALVKRCRYSHIARDDDADSGLIPGGAVSRCEKRFLQSENLGYGVCVTADQQSGFLVPVRKHGNAK
jgi:hypothetical protein